MDGGERRDRDAVAILEGYKAIFDVVASSIDGMDYRAHIHMKSRHEGSPYVLTPPARAVHEVIRRSPWRPPSYVVRPAGQALELFDGNAGKLSASWAVDDWQALEDPLRRPPILRLFTKRSSAAFRHPANPGRVLANVPAVV